jgi:hypothetical protein
MYDARIAINALGQTKNKYNVLFIIYYKSELYVKNKIGIFNKSVCIRQGLFQLSLTHEQ